MPDFVEQATLRVKDQATKPIRKINGELTKLLKQMEKVEKQGKALSRLHINFTGISGAINDVNRLLSTMRQVKSKNVNLRARVSNPKTIRNELNTLARTREAKIRATAANVKATRTLLNNLSRNRTVSINTRMNGVGLTPGAGMTGTVRVDTAGLRSALRASWAELGHEIRMAVVEGFRRGAASQDVASTRLQLQDLAPAQARQVNALGGNLAAEFTAFTRGEIQGALSELIPVVRGDQEALNLISREVLRMAQLQVALGSSAEQAIDQAFLFAKAGESAGRFTDADGNIDKEGVDQFFDLLTKGMIEFGREIDANLVRTLTKSLRASRFGLDERGFLTSLLVAEEQGSTAGVGINQLIKQLSGERIQKRQLAELIRLGLVGQKEVKTGTQGGKVVTEVVAAGAVDEDLLRSNIQGWVLENIIPVMEREGFDPANAVDASRFAGSITSDRTATDALVNAILRAQEIRDTVDRALAKDTSDARVDDILATSFLLQLEEVRGQFSSVLGEVARSMETVLLPALNVVSDGLQGLASFLSGPDGEGDPLRTGAVAAGGVATTGAALFGGKKLLDLFNPLNKSAVALNGSAAQLNAAATALQRAAGAQGAAGLGQGTGRGKGGAGRPNLGLGGGRALLTGVGALGLATMDSSPEAAEVRSDAIEKGVRSAFESIGLGDFAKWMNDRRAENEQLAREGEVGWLTRVLNSAAGQPLPAADPVLVAAKEQAAMDAETSARIDRLLGVIERNADRIASPDNSEKADLNLLKQQSNLAAQILALGGEQDAIVEALTSEGVSSEMLRQAFEQGAEGLSAVFPELLTAADEFGPRAGEGLLAIAPQMGQAMGEAAAAALANTQLSIRPNRSDAVPSLDQGAAQPF